jgi:hypothetical protein
MNFDFLSTDRFAVIEGFALAQPPTWTRLEPQCVAGDPRPGIEARVHDPLWCLARQWQLGEFEGEDAGTPLTVRVVTRTVAIDRWAAGDEGEPREFGRDRRDLLEPQVEREPVGTVSVGLRARAESAAVLLASLDDAGLSAYRTSLIAACPLDLDTTHYPDGAHAALDPEWARLVRLLGGRGTADAESICQALEAAADLPAWLGPAAGADHDALRAVLDEWRAWYRAEVSPAPGGDDAWVGERLEYRFRAGAGPLVFDAPAHRGGAIDWYVFDTAPHAALPQPAEATNTAPERREVHAVLASPLRYPGMPADRLWEIEDARVNLGLIEAEPWDLARLLVAEFALTYGNDWLIVPVDVPFGSVTTIESLTYTTTFGEHFVVRPTDEVSPDGRWRMYTITTRTKEGRTGLLIPPGAIAVQDGPAIEEVLFVRDEMANLAWAIERSVQGPSGQARERARERDDRRPIAPGPVDRAQLDYILQTGLPARWIPYLPRTSATDRAIDLVQGRMPAADGTPIVPLGRLLNDDAIKVLKDAEVPREGLVVRRQPSLTRTADGTYARWTTRRVVIGRGEGSSHLAFDSAVPRRPEPNA